MFVSVCVTEGVQSGIEVTETVTSVPNGVRDDAIIYAPYDYDTAKGGPTHCVAAHDDCDHFQGFVEPLLCGTGIQGQTPRLTGQYSQLHFTATSLAR